MEWVKSGDFGQMGYILMMGTSGWGKNLGKINHPTAIPAVQIQEEVLLNSEKIKL
ncbi:hypothetical protein [Flavobacterium sp. HJJ]|uniref:hypothetical protein n=1 Tax=Flavobacterium sp. HJJ TaxID=2783792 RepID=UPI00188AC9E4|nr:hypothetical protein [Flavobacterium sp. HJJ]MBF4470620.1 hypothetical protein [Flavobacterium sp. HJJ]